MRLVLFMPLLVSSLAAGAENPWGEPIADTQHPLWQNSGALEVDDLYASKLHQGNGDISQKIRELPPFNSIELLIPALLVYRPGSDPQVTVAADSNLLGIIETVVVGKTLRITANQGFSTGTPIKITSRSETIAGATLQGSGYMNLVGLTSPLLTLHVLGSGDISVSGNIDLLDVTLQGSGNLDASQLQARGCQLAVQGSGEIRSLCTDALVAKLSGSGNILVEGEPESTSISELGSGNVIVRTRDH